VSEDFSDAALVLVGHGSTVNADSAAPTWLHADELRRRGLFAQVRETFWKQEPYLWQALRGIFAPRVFVVPLFISEGYFTQEVIPRELGFCRAGETNFARAQQRGGQMFHYCGPVGTHPSMTEVLLARARDIERQVELIRRRRLYAEVHAVFMEEDPRIGDCCRLAGVKNIVMVPFFISDGLHSYEDIPVMLGASESVVRERLKQGQPTWRNPTEREGRRIWYTASVGSEPHLPEVILQRVREAAGA
jgi:sirohydrochlorin cobaltochelatase